MSTYFIVDSGTYEATNWRPDGWLDVGPRFIESGSYSGSYAVNTLIFTSASPFESYRSLLESLPVENCSNPEDWWPTGDASS